MRLWSYGVPFDRKGVMRLLIELELLLERARMSGELLVATGDWRRVPGRTGADPRGRQLRSRLRRNSRLAREPSTRLTHSYH